MQRTGAGHQNAVAAQNPHGHLIDVPVALHTFADIFASLHEGGRIKQHEIEPLTRSVKVLEQLKGIHVRSLNSHGIVPIKDGEVSHTDVERVIDAARAVANAGPACWASSLSPTYGWFRGVRRAPSRSARLPESR